MTDERANAEDCRELFQLMKMIRDLAPWDWMEETDLFGLKHPDTDDIAFISVMGSAGEYLSIAAYLGVRGLFTFYEMQKQGPYINRELVLNTPQIHASFENRSDLTDYDYQLIKSLGLKFRGRYQWPQFRSFRPGYVPWNIDVAEAKFLAYVLQQIIEFTPQIRDNPRIINTRRRNAVVVRVPEKRGDQLVWKNETHTFKRPAQTPIKLAFDETLVDELEALEYYDGVFEMDVFMYPAPIGEEGKRPIFPYVFSMVDANHDQIICNTMVQPLPSIEDMWSQMPNVFAQELINFGAVPRIIRLSDPFAFEVFRPLGKALGIKMRRANYLPVMEQTKAGLFRYMQSMR